ncbi:hypothetical protein [Bacillus cereus]|uniref:hypothetical protein n=1 Tax=Bacillus cereus TaxID=1396 RepID=UPI001C8C3A76|nr:hypothetical protein [Bacillus cereus]MBX9158609.1 hypothetical protein [Bacillus cereus]
MIPFNLKVEKYKNHPMDNKFGMIITNTQYANYPVTIVDNSDEVEDGKYTRKPALCLLHLSENVRTYTRLKLFSELLYVSFAWKEPTYRMYEYKKEELSNEKVIAILHGVLYGLQPRLQTRSLVGWKSEKLEDDPNYYVGYYVLNDEEEYTVFKCGKKYGFVKGRYDYSKLLETSDNCLYVGEIDFELYALAVEVHERRGRIVTQTNQMLDEGKEDSILEYRDLNKKLEGLLVEKSYC